MMVGTYLEPCDKMHHVNGASSAFFLKRPQPPLAVEQSRDRATEGAEDVLGVILFSWHPSKKNQVLPKPILNPS